MDIQHIREFIDLANTCSFHDTAERFFISDSALSKHINKLEEELGVSLFDRSTRTVKLSKNGELFYTYAQQIDKNYVQALAALNDMNADDEYSLLVGYWPSFERFGILDLIARFADEHPYINIDVVETDHPRQKLRQGECQFVFDFESNKDDIVNHPFKTDEIMVLVPPDHPLAGNKTVTIAQLEGEQFLMRSGQLGIIEYDEFSKLCLSNGFAPRVVKSANYSATLIRHVSQGEGIAVLSRMFIPDSLASKVSALTLEPSISVSICVQQLKSHQLSTADVCFLEFMRHL